MVVTIFLEAQMGELRYSACLDICRTEATRWSGCRGETRDAKGGRRWLGGVRVELGRVGEDRLDVAVPRRRKTVVARRGSTRQT